MQSVLDQKCESNQVGWRRSMKRKPLRNIASRVVCNEGEGMLLHQPAEQEQGTKERY